MDPCAALCAAARESCSIRAGALPQNGRADWLQQLLDFSLAVAAHIDRAKPVTALDLLWEP